MVDPNVSYNKVHASRGKVIRAEPVAALYEQGRIHHVGAFPTLEDQQCAFTTDFDRKAAGILTRPGRCAGLGVDRPPRRADAGRGSFRIHAPASGGTEEAIARAAEAGLYHRQHGMGGAAGRKGRITRKLEALLFPPPPAIAADQRPMSDWTWVHRELRPICRLRRPHWRGRRKPRWQHDQVPLLRFLTLLTAQSAEGG